MKRPFLIFKMAILFFLNFTKLTEKIMDNKSIRKLISVYKLMLNCFGALNSDLQIDAVVLK